MTKLSVAMLDDINKETVDFKPNYDDRLKEPEVLPSHFPNLLVNGSMVLLWVWPPMCPPTT